MTTPKIPWLGIVGVPEVFLLYRLAFLDPGDSYPRLEAAL